MTPTSPGPTGNTQPSAIFKKSPRNLHGNSKSPRKDRADRSSALKPSAVLTLLKSASAEGRVTSHPIGSSKTKIAGWRIRARRRKEITRCRPSNRDAGNLPNAAARLCCRTHRAPACCGSDTPTRATHSSSQVHADSKSREGSSHAVRVEHATLPRHPHPDVGTQAVSERHAGIHPASKRHRRLVAIADNSSCAASARQSHAHRYRPCSRRHRGRSTPRSPNEYTRKPVKARACT